MATTVNNPHLDRLLEAERIARFAGTGRKGTRSAVLEQLAIERLRDIERERKQDPDWPGEIQPQ